MKKKIILAATCLLLVSGCGRIPTLSNGEEAVVTFKNGDMISVNDLYNEVKTNYALSSLINMVDKKILEDKYKDEIKNAEEYADASIEAMIEQYGDEDTLLQVIQYYTGLSSINAYKDQIYLSYFQNLAVVDYAKSKITEKEIKAYYKDSIYGDIEVSHILITPEVLSDSTDEEKEALESEAESKAKDIISKLKEAKKNKEDIKEAFATLAKEYSNDDSTKENGGSLGYVNYTTLSSDYKNLLDAAYKLNNNEFSTEVIKTTLGYHVILKTGSKEKAALDDVRETIIETLADDLVNTDNTVSINAMQAIRKEYGVDITDSELQKQYANYIQNLLSKAQNSNE